MSALLRRPVTLIWIVLMLATSASTWWLGKDAFSARTATVLIMTIAAFKARLVLLHFIVKLTPV